MLCLGRGIDSVFKKLNLDISTWIARVSVRKEIGERNGVLSMQRLTLLVDVRAFEERAQELGRSRKENSVRFQHVQRKTTSFVKNMLT